MMTMMTMTMMMMMMMMMMQGHFAGMGGSVRMCTWLGEECGLPLDRRQRSGHTALHKAADCGKVRIENGFPFFRLSDENDRSSVKTGSGRSIASR
jgi:hypothetical protein